MPAGKSDVLRVVRRQADGRPGGVELGDICITASPLSESRLPVGSSASKSAAPAIARAIATSC